MTPDEVRFPSPADYIEAWKGAVMYSPHPKSAARDEMHAYPPPADMPDPIFWSPEHPSGEKVWHRAKDISSPTAMDAMATYLHAKGLVLPPDITATWVKVMEQDQWVNDILTEVKAALVELAPAAISRGALTAALLEHLTEVRASLGDHT